MLYDPSILDDKRKISALVDEGVLEPYQWGCGCNMTHTKTVMIQDIRVCLISMVRNHIRTPLIPQRPNPNPLTCSWRSITMAPCCGGCNNRGESVGG